jgi:hypothetical protein
MSTYWINDEEILFREKLIAMVNTEFKMGHDSWVEESILDVLPELNPGEIHEWVDKDLLPPTHLLRSGIHVKNVMEALESPEHSAPFPLDEEFFGIFRKSVGLKMANCCGCKRCGTLAKENDGKADEASSPVDPEHLDHEYEKFIKGF